VEIIVCLCAWVLIHNKYTKKGLAEIRLREDHVTQPELISTFSRIARLGIINFDVQISIRACGNFFRFFDAEMEQFDVVGANPTLL
jgi:hypothetical protein